MIRGFIKIKYKLVGPQDHFVYLIY